MKKTLSVITKSFVILLLALTFWGAIAVACVSPPDKPPKPTPPPKPEKIITRPCKPLKPSYDGKAKTYPLSDPCYALYNLNQIIDEEDEEGIEGVLPKLLSSELTQNFSPEEFEQAVNEATETFGEIVSFNFPSEFSLQGDWAEATLETITSSGQNLRFLVIFHQEGNSWKIFATEEI